MQVKTELIYNQLNDFVIKLVVDNYSYLIFNFFPNLYNKYINYKDVEKNIFKSIKKSNLL